MKELLQQKLQEKFIIAPNTLIDEKVSAEAVTTYLLLKEHATVLNMCETTLNIMAKNITNSNISKMVNAIRPAIQELVDLDYIGVFSSEYDVQEDTFKEVDSNNLKANDSFIVVFKDYDVEYFKVPYITYRNVLEVAKDVKSRYGFIAYFSAIMRFTNTNNNYPKVAYVAPSIWNKYAQHNRTIAEYQDILSENALAWISEQRYYTPETGKSRCACVGRMEHFEDYEKFEKHVTAHAIHSKWVETNQEQINRKRSISKKKYWDNKTSQEQQVETQPEEVQEIQTTVLVKGMVEDAQIDLKKLLINDKISQTQYVAYMSEVEEKGFICDWEEILIRMIKEIE